MAERYGRTSSYTSWCAPHLVANALDLLEKELPRYKGRIRSVHLCFSTDPFMVGYPEVTRLSLAILERLALENIPCSMLTKGILPCELADEKRFGAQNTHGISLVSLDEDFRRKWEPGAAPYRERIAALRYLHDKGRKTWVHMEPYPTPNIVRQDIRDILDSIAFVDSISFSGWNYNPIVRRYPGFRSFYAEQEKIVEKYRGIHDGSC